MYIQTPTRNQRSSRFHVKHALQTCLLLLVCCLFTYQVKHCLDKKPEFDESGSGTLTSRASSDKILNLGRKGIHRRVQETIFIMDEVHDGEAIEEEIMRKEEDEASSGRTIEVDENEQAKSNEDSNKEKEEGDENENEERVSGLMDHENSIEDNDLDGYDRSALEARERYYNADDAASAVIY